jgi:hypothetical protein
MTEQPRKAAGTARRGAGDAGMDARSRATQGAVADDAARAAKVRRSAWLLAGLALFFYVGYLAWMFLRSAGGG